MPTSRPVRVIRTLLAVVVVTVLAARPCAASAIDFTNLEVVVDPTTLIVEVSAGLLAHADSGTVGLDGISVSLSQEGTPLDLLAGPTTLDDLPFYLNTPFSMSDGETLAPVVLFRLLNVVAGASYSGSFFLSEGLAALEDPPQEFAFTVSTVPEPASLLLLVTGFGALVIVGRRTGMRRRSC